MATGLYHVSLHIPGGVTDVGTMAIDGLISGDDVLYDPGGPAFTPIRVTAVTTIPAVMSNGGPIDFSAGPADLTGFSITGATGVPSPSPTNIAQVSVTSGSDFGPVVLTHGAPILVNRFNTSVSVVPIGWLGVQAHGRDVAGQPDFDFEGQVEFTFVASAPQPVVGSIGAAAAAAGLGL